MDDFGNIVYVIIAMGWFAWNAYRKSQENKRSQPSPSGGTPRERTEPTKSFEEMIFEQFEGRTEPKPEVVETVHQNQDKFLSSDLSHSHLPNDYQMSKTEMSSHRVERQIKPLEIEEEEALTLMDIVAPNGFDLRQAIVLNAVLERPYK